MLVLSLRNVDLTCTIAHIVSMGNMFPQKKKANGMGWGPTSTARNKEPSFDNYSRARVISFMILNGQYRFFMAMMGQLTKYVQRNT